MSTTNKLRLKVGKRYVTMHGQVTCPLQRYDSEKHGYFDEYPFKAHLANGDGPFTWTPTGEFHTMMQHCLDLVAEYEEPAPTPSQSYPLKNRSGDPFAPANRTPLFHLTEPPPVDGWHGPIKGPIRDSNEIDSNIACWIKKHFCWDFGKQWRGNDKHSFYLVRKGTALAAELGLEKASTPYPTHTPPEPPSPWHRWEYCGKGVEGLKPPWYSVSDNIDDASVSDIQTVNTSIGLLDFHYFQAVTDAPMLCVNGIWFPEPHKTKLTRGQSFYIPTPQLYDGIHCITWENDDSDNHMLASGLIHLTPGAAAAHSRAMLSIAEKGDQP